MPIGRDAIDHENMSVVVPGSDPCALKAGNLGRHVRRRHLHIELVRQWDDRFRIDGERLGLNVVRPTHEYHPNYHQQVAHVPPEAQSKSHSAMASRGNGHIKITHYKEAPLVRQCTVALVSDD